MRVLLVIGVLALVSGCAGAGFDRTSVYDQTWECQRQNGRWVDDGFTRGCVYGGR